MWFVTLALLIVAVYFLYDAFKDRELTRSGHSIATAQKVNPEVTDRPVEYQNTLDRNSASGLQGDSSDETSDADKTSIQTSLSTEGGSVVTSQQHDSALASKAATGKLQFLDAPIGEKDDLTRIDGIDPVIEERLNELGLFHYHQVGNFSDSDIESVNTALGHPGRIENESWIQQAQKLMEGAGTTNVSAGSAHISLDSEHDAPPAGQSQSQQSPLDTEKTQLGAGAAIGAATLAAATAVTHANQQRSETLDNGDIQREASGISDEDVFVIDAADLTGAWNTDVLIEIQERLKALNTRESDAPRLDITRDQYNAIKNDDDSGFTRDELKTILQRLRTLST